MKDQLRIALIASNRHPIRQPFAGGLESHVWHLARALARHGHLVSLFAGTGSDPALECAPLTVCELILSDAARRDVSMPAPAFMADHHAYLAMMLELAADGAANFDVVHNHSLHHLPVAMAPMLPIPVLTTVHTPPTPWLESALGASAATAGTGTRLAAVSRHTAASWAQLAPEIAVVPNGVDTAQWRLGRGGPHLVWFGRITPEKGTHLAIAAAQLAGYPLVLAGPVSDPDYFAEYVSPHLDGDIRYAGHLHQDELATLVGSAAAALVTPMWDEPYGLVIAEAMACGTPVIAFNRGGIPELMSAQAGALVASGDVTAMAAAIPGVLELSRRSVRAHAKRRCSAEAMVRSYLTLYSQMIDDVRNGSDDRLLRSPSRLRASGEGNQHRRGDASARHGAEQPRGSQPEPLRSRGPACA